MIVFLRANEYSVLQSLSFKTCLHEKHFQLMVRLHISLIDVNAHDVAILPLHDYISHFVEYLSADCLLQSDFVSVMKSAHVFTNSSVLNGETTLYSNRIGMMTTQFMINSTQRSR